METKATKIKAFNSILESFLAQTSLFVGTTYHFYFKQLIKINAPLPIKCAVDHMCIFEEQIMNKDESYFNGSDDINIKSKFNEVTELSRLPTEQVISELLRLKDIYYKLDIDSKENVWAILQALLQLTKEYKELKNKTMN